MKKMKQYVKLGGEELYEEVTNCTFQPLHPREQSTEK
jgi:hypothetical protein